MSWYCQYFAYAARMDFCRLHPFEFYSYRYDLAGNTSKRLDDFITGCWMAGGPL